MLDIETKANIKTQHNNSITHTTIFSTWLTSQPITT
jgi:hypothetical protein